jgi:nucleoside-diphosphate-sugar epimerase
MELKMKKLKILLTGSDGYIGTKMAQFLLERGHDVTGVDTGFYREGWLFNGIKKLPKVITKDTRQITLKDLKGFDAIIHLADLSNDPLGQQDPDLTYKINHSAIVRLAKLAKKAGIKRFIYSSSCSIYGIATEDMVTELSKVNPQTAYAKCKYLVEQHIRKLSDKNFSPTFMRNATVYGPSPRMRFDLVVNNLSGIAWTEKKIRLASDGTPWRPLVHILDVCEAFITVLEAPKALIHNQVFNVGNNESNYQIKDIAKIVAKVFPGCKVSYGSSSGDTRSYKVSFSKISKTFPKLKLKRTVKQGVKDLRVVFKSISMSKDQFEFRGFTRLNQIDHLRKTNQLDKDFYWREVI